MSEGIITISAMRQDFFPNKIHFIYRICCHDEVTEVVTNLQWHWVIRNKGNLEVSANQLAPQVILTCISRDAFSHKIDFIYHNFTQNRKRGGKNVAYVNLGSKFAVPRNPPLLHFKTDTAAGETSSSINAICGNKSICMQKNTVRNLPFQTR